jgi:hypothetical protein
MGRLAMSQPAIITVALLDRILGLLAPIFLVAAGGDMEAARAAVNSMLACYNVRTDEELRLVALTIAFSFGALDALGLAANPDLSLNQVLRLRGNATALSRASHQSRATFDKQRKQPQAEPDARAEETPLPASVEAPDLSAFARSVMRARNEAPVSVAPVLAAPVLAAPVLAAPVRIAAAPAAPLSRQQRRAGERQAEKVQRRQEHDIRRAALLAARETV